MKDITIKRADEDKTRKALGAATLDDLAYIYFELSEVPGSDWAAKFDTSLAKLLSEITPEPNLGAYISGLYLVAKCPLCKIEEHLPLLKLAVQAANSAYQKELEKRAKDAEKERAYIKTTLEKLTFD